MSMNLVTAQTDLTKPVAKRNVSPESILAVTRRIIEEQGLSGAQARPIAEAAGCSVGTLYNVFDSLDTLILRVNAETMSELCMQVRQVLDRSLRAAPAPVEHIVALAGAYLDFAQANTLRWSAVFEFRRASHAQMPAWYDEQIVGLFALVEESIAGLPGLKDEAQRAETARALWASIHGMVAMAFAGRIAPIDPSNVRRHLEGILRAVWAGIAAESAPRGA